MKLLRDSRRAFLGIWIREGGFLRTDENLKDPKKKHNRGTRGVKERKSDVTDVRKATRKWTKYRRPREIFQRRMLRMVDKESHEMDALTLAATWQEGGPFSRRALLSANKKTRLCHGHVSRPLILRLGHIVRTSFPLPPRSVVGCALRAADLPRSPGSAGFFVLVEFENVVHMRANNSKAVESFN